MLKRLMRRLKGRRLVVRGLAAELHHQPTLRRESSACA
jgi:hypothetical protein